MQLILDFDTNTTVEQHLSELAEFLEKVRIMRAVSYSELQKRAKKLDCGVNLAVRIKNANMVGKSLNILAEQTMLNFDFKIQDQTGEILCQAQNSDWVETFFYFLVMYNQEIKVSREKFSKFLGVSNYSAAKWKTSKEITLKYLFKCLKAMHLKMIFETK